MSNIVGEPTPKYVIDQVNARQTIHGKSVRSNEDLVYLNSKTAWVKLASSVKVQKDKIKNPTIKNIGLFEDELAKSFILFNGTTNNSTQKSGIARNGFLNNSGAYGLGGLEFGLSPMMGIQNAIINYKNRGSIRSAKVDIIANNRQQFEIIETLYIKLGYFMLLEWGWSNYVKNNGTTFEQDNKYSILNDFLARKSYDDLIDKIEIQKEKSEGNYDALIGKVVNFNWTFTPEGQYKISLDLISMGDVIESLKVNTLLPKDIKKAKEGKQNSGSAGTAGTAGTSGQTSGSTSDDDSSDPKSPEEIIISYMDKSSLGNFFGKNVKKLDANTRLEKTINGKKVISFIKTEYAGGSADGEGTTIYYVLFQRLLLYIENFLVPTIKNGKSKFINFNIDVDDQLILLPPLTLSTDPRVCNFNSQWKHGEKTGFSTLYGSEDFTKTVGENTHGRLLNVYFNIQWILETLDQLKDENGNVVLIDFLNALLRGYESCTGNYNKLSADIDDTTNIITFRDEVQSPDLQKEEEKKPTAFFNTFGYNGTQSNFVKNLNFNTTVTPNMATMITIGATSEGTSPGYDATGLRSINFGTVDAIKPELINPSTKKSTSTEGEESKNVEDLDAKYKEAFNHFNNYVKLLTGYGNNKKPTLDTEAANSYKGALQFFIEYNQIKKLKESKNESASTPTIGFIPFDLGLSIDGLSGIKIYQKIEVESKFLPYSYPSSLKFIIRGVEHTINNNQWTTNLTTLAIPASTVGSGKDANETDGTSPTGIGGGGSGGGGTRGGGDPSSWVNKTITSGFPLNPKGHDKRTFDKTQIILHYSAGHQRTDKGQSTLNTLNKRGLSYHYIIDAAGHIEQVVPDRVRAFNAGNANPPSIGISLQNLGYADDVNTSSWGPIPKNESRAAHLVDYNGKNTTYRGISYAQEITDAQLASLKKLFTKIYKNNPTLPPYKWEGKKTYDKLFPPSVKGVKKTSWEKGLPGYYTHCSVTTGKLDCMPTPKIVNFFKTLKLTGPQTLKEITYESLKEEEVSITNFKTLATKLGSIYKLTDNENPTGPGALFTPAKGTFNDNEDLALQLLNKWFTSPQIKKLYSGLAKTEKEIFDKTYNLLKERTNKSNPSKVIFTLKSPPFSVIIDPDF